MEIKNLLRIKERKDLRAWLNENSRTQEYCWVLVSIKPKDGTLLYLDVVEESLCYGWIDGVKKKTEDGHLAQRLSPRSRKSNWTELNKERVRRLERLGLMTEGGRKVLPDMREESFVVDEKIIETIKSDVKTYDNYQKLPELYRRIRIDNIQSVRKDRELYEKRLIKFVEATRESKLYGKWDDDGRLIDYGE